MLTKQVKTMYDTVEFGILSCVRPQMFFSLPAPCQLARRRELHYFWVYAHPCLLTLFTIVRTWNKT